MALAQLQTNNWPVRDEFTFSQPHQLSFYDLKGPVKQASQIVYENKRRRWWSIRKKEIVVKNFRVGTEFLISFNENGHLTYGIEEREDKSISTFSNRAEVDLIYYEYNQNDRVSVCRTSRGYANAYDSIFYNEADLPARYVDYGFDGKVMNELIYRYDQKDRLIHLDRFYTGSLFTTEDYTYLDSTYEVEAKRYFLSGGFASEKRIHQLNGEILNQKIDYPNGPNSEMNIIRDEDGNVLVYEDKEWNAEGVLTKNQKKEYRYNLNGDIIKANLYGDTQHRKGNYLTSDWNYQYDESGELKQVIGQWYDQAGGVYKKEIESRFYDEKNNLIQINRETGQEGEMNDSNDTKLIYDELGNWLRKEFYFAGKKQYVIVREISYYES